MIRFYRGLTRDVSLLLGHGHCEAMAYPVGKVWSECNIVRRRIAQEVRLNATVMQTAIASILSKKGGKQFKELLENLDDGG